MARQLIKMNLSPRYLYKFQFYIENDFYIALEYILIYNRICYVDRTIVYSTASYNLNKPKDIL